MRVALFLGFDFRIKGGLISMVRAAFRAIRGMGAEVDCYMPSLGADRMRWGVRAVHDEGMVWNAAGTIPGAPNFVGPWLTAAQLRSSLGQYDLVQSVVGGGGWSLPGRLGRHSVTWVATPYQEDLLPRLRLDRPWKRAATRGLLLCENTVEGMALRAQDRVLALSNKTRDLLIARHRLSPSAVQVLYPPVDSSIFRPETAIDQDICITTSRLDDERKQVPLLVRSWSHVVASRPNARLVLVGPYRPDGPVDRAVKGSPVRSNIELTGELPPDVVAKRLREARLFVLPSRQEGFGIVALEALACGTPVVTFENGGTDELVRVSGGGWVVQDPTEAGLQATVSQALEDRVAWARHRDAGLRFVEQRANPQSFRETLQQVYDEVLH